MDFTIPAYAASELAAAFFQAAVVLGLTALCALLYRRHRKAHLAVWSVAWGLYALRMGAIISFLATTDRHWLYWHQVATGWTALAFLWAALTFSDRVAWRTWYLIALLFPPIWSYLAIYQLDSFMLAAVPAVGFLSIATLGNAWVFHRYARLVESGAATFLAVTLFLWALHHFDYPFLRAQGAWNPWGYYLDTIFVLALGAGVLLLVNDDLHRGIRILSALSGDARTNGRAPRTARIVERPLDLPAVTGSALFLKEPNAFVHAVGACATFPTTTPNGPAARALATTLSSGNPAVARVTFREHADYTYCAALPIYRQEVLDGALVVVGHLRDPFASIDREFLMALGHQVGTSLENADLYQRLEDRTRDLERLAARMVSQLEDERKRISRGLHDESAQVLSAVKLQLGLATEAAPDDLLPRLTKVSDLVDTGIQTIRDVTNALRPSSLDDLGLVPALRALTDDFRADTEMDVEFETSHDHIALPEAAELAIFRALQEGLSNIGRHAKAQHACIHIQDDGQMINLTVSDDGVGPGNAEHTYDGAGLTGMRERIVALGGSVRMQRGPLPGTTLTVTVPRGNA